MFVNPVPILLVRDN